MIAKIMTVLGIQDTDDTTESMSRREFPRRASDKCIGVINGQAMPILDWSQGGIRVFGETRTYSVGDQVDVTLKFHMANDLIDVQHKAKVVRKSAEVFALQFTPLTGEIRKTFQQIIDNFNAEEFVASQA